MSTTLNKIEELRPIRFNEESKTPFLIDQRLLPYEFKYTEIKSYTEMADAIKDMLVRGAPAIGISAAFAMYLAAKEFEANSELNILEELKKADQVLRNTRPTAVNLMWALDEIQAVIDNTKTKFSEAILEKAKWILEDDIDRCKKMGAVGAEYIKNKFKNKIQNGEKLKVMTHCNAGALATGGYGTALGVIRKLHEENLIEMVYSDETRPRQQGSRLTAWELAYDHIPVTMNTDNMAAHLMKEGKVDFVITGSDRITKNGDAANKIGTYQLAISANYHKLPFFVAAPMSTVDINLERGDQIPIEQRDYKEVSHINGISCTATNKEVKNYDLKGNKHLIGELSYENPGFDVTPSELIEAIFTERGLF